MAKKIITSIAFVIAILFIASLCLFAHGATDDIFQTLINPKTQPEMPLTLGENGKIEGFFTCDSGTIKSIASWEKSDKNKLVMAFCDLLSTEIWDIWSKNGYQVIIFNDRNADIFGFIGAYSDYLNLNSFGEIRFVGIGEDYARLSVSSIRYLAQKARLYPGKRPEKLTVYEESLDKIYPLEESIYTLWKDGTAVEVLTNSEAKQPMRGATIVYPTTFAGYSETLNPGDEIYDKRMNNSTEKVPSALSSVSYILLRAGTVYKIYDGQNVMSENIETAVVGGIASVSCRYGTDARLDKVKIELYLISGTERRLMGDCITDKSGFYRLQIPKIYANGFDEFYLVIYPPNGYSLTSQSTTETFVFPHMKSSVTIDIGAVKNEE